MEGTKVWWEPCVRCETFSGRPPAQLSLTYFGGSPKVAWDDFKTYHFQILTDFRRRRAVFECKEEASQGRIRLKEKKIMSSKMKVASQHWTDWTDWTDWTVETIEINRMI